MLRSSALELPILLLMGSSPDYQGALERLGSDAASDPNGGDTGSRADSSSETSRERSISCAGCLRASS
jgi:hypothetical protein